MQPFSVTHSLSNIGAGHKRHIPKHQDLRAHLRTDFHVADVQASRPQVSPASAAHPKPHPNPDTQPRSTVAGREIERPDSARSTASAASGGKRVRCRLSWAPRGGRLGCLAGAMRCRGEGLPESRSEMGALGSESADSDVVVVLHGYCVGFPLVLHWYCVGSPLVLHRLPSEVMRRRQPVRPPEVLGGRRPTAEAALDGPQRVGA